jgi:hypothetical protein
MNMKGGKIMSIWSKFISIMVITMLFIAHSSVFSETGEKEMGEKKGLKVTILLFSGRPDPTYIIDDKETIGKIRTLIGSAKKNDKFEMPTVIPSILGYKGIIVDNQTKISDIPNFVAIYKGNIEVKNETKKFLIDEGSTLENLFLNEGIKKGVIEEKIMKRMKSER